MLKVCRRKLFSLISSFGLSNFFAKWQPWSCPLIIVIINIITSFLQFLLVDSRLLQMQQCSKYSSSWQSKKNGINNLRQKESLRITRFQEIAGEPSTSNLQQVGMNIHIKNTSYHHHQQFNNIFTINQMYINIYITCNSCPSPPLCP